MGVNQKYAEVKRSYRSQRVAGTSVELTPASSVASSSWALSAAAAVT